MQGGKANLTNTKIKVGKKEISECDFYKIYINFVCGFLVIRNSHTGAWQEWR